MTRSGSHAPADGAGEPGRAGGFSVDPGEIARFSAMADGWWDEAGPSRPLHRLNPIRVAFVRDHFARLFGVDPAVRRPFAGLRLLDIGCGGGLVSEPMARLGFAVTGIDASEATIKVARTHAEAQDLAIDYRVATVEDLAGEGAAFDAVLALEVVEHVAEPGAFLAGVAGLVRPGGGLVLSTLNRTAAAFMLGIVGAEYILRWVPRGTHQWQKFVKPSELAGAVRGAGMVVSGLKGLSYDPLNDQFHLSSDLSVNYLMAARK